MGDIKKWNVVEESSYLVKCGHKTVAIVDKLLCGFDKAEGVAHLIAKLPYIINLLQRIEADDYTKEELVKLNNEIEELR